MKVGLQVQSETEAALGLVKAINENVSQGFH